MEKKFKQTPPRLNQIFQRYDPPLYLVTICALLRQRILACMKVHEAFRDYCVKGADFGVAVGRYVIMPDHIHAFLRISGSMTLSRWVKGMKRSLDAALDSTGHKPISINGGKLRSFWQPGVFDHLLRNSESYAQKWDYVWRNPLRAGLVTRSDDWPYQGEIVVIDRV